MAAAISAVEMYLQEERSFEPEHTKGLSAWKRVAWQMVRGERRISPQSGGSGMLSAWKRAGW